MSIDALRQQGAEAFDPVRFRFLEALARRAAAHQGEARRILDEKLEKALAEFRQRFHQAQAQASDTLARLAEQFPAAADDLRQLYGAGDFGGLGRFAARLETPCPSGALAELVAYIGAQGLEIPEAGPASGAGARAEPQAELKSVAYFRSTWSKLSIDQQLAQALAQAPENAGPLNSHLLVLRSLKLMRDISPDYLNRFMSYVDALLWLDQAEGGGVPAQKNAPRGEGEKKRKSGRGKAG